MARTLTRQPKSYFRKIGALGGAAGRAKSIADVMADPRLRRKALRTARRLGADPESFYRAAQAQTDRKGAANRDRV